MNWRRDVQLAPEYITQTQSGEGLEYGYRRQANQDDRKRRIKLKIRSRNANPEKSKARAGGSGVEASGGGMTGEPSRMGGVPGKESAEKTACLERKVSHRARRADRLKAGPGKVQCYRQAKT